MLTAASGCVVDYSLSPLAKGRPLVCILVAQLDLAWHVDDAVVDAELLGDLASVPFGYLLVSSTRHEQYTDMTRT